MLPDDRTQQILATKNPDQALAACQKHGYSEGWAIIDGAIVIYNLDAPPHWLPTDLDEDGNTPGGRAKKFPEDDRSPRQSVARAGS